MSNVLDLSISIRPEARPLQAEEGMSLAWELANLVGPLRRTALKNGSINITSEEVLDLVFMAQIGLVLASGKFSDDIKVKTRDLSAATGILTSPSVERQKSALPRIWDLMGFLLPRESRLRVYKPAIEERKLDYYEAFEANTGKWARRWLGFCFAFRTAVLVGDCWRLSGVERMARWFHWLFRASLVYWLFHR